MKHSLTHNADHAQAVPQSDDLDGWVGPLCGRHGVGALGGIMSKDSTPNGEMLVRFRINQHRSN